MSMIDRIKYDGNPQGNQWLIYKCPSDQFVLGSQLIVGEGQEAIFFRGGQALDVFRPGTHTLSTGNLPLLNRLVNLPFGGKTPFTAEIYYVNRTANLDMKWGTSVPIPMEDPKYGLLLNVGARGQYGVTIEDSRLFVTRIVGAIPGGTEMNHLLILRYFNGMINSRVKSIVSEYMIARRISFLEVTQYLTEISQSFQEALTEELQNFGISLTNFYCDSIAPRPEDYEKLRTYKEELALGEDFYQRRRSLDILEKLADNPSAGGAANAGIGLGMGFGVAGQVGGLFAGLAQNVAPHPQENAGGAVRCPNCGASNPASRRFCGECGNRLAAGVICPHCGAENQPGMRFCGECGQQLAAVSRCSACGFENPPGTRFCGNCGQRL